MLTALQNIRYRYDDFMRAHGAGVAHTVRRALIIVLVALLLEVFLFNINFFRTLGYTEVSLNDQLTLAQSADGRYKLTEGNHVIEFSGLDTEVKNIWIDFDESQSAQELTLKIQFTDEAHKTYFDTTEYTYGPPEVDVSTKVAESEYLNINAAGTVSNLRIEVVSDASYPLYFEDISINKPEPFNFNTGRFVVVMAIIALIYLFRPGSRIYKVRLTEHPKFTKRAIVATVIVELYLMSAFLFMGSNLVGVATSTYNSGSWDGESVVNVFEVGGDNAQQYAELARALANGNTYLEEEPPQWLQEMSDPYDKGARDELQKETGEEYLFDVAYYDGHYYVYFGIVPCLIFYLPFYLVTGQNFPTAIGILIMCMLFVLGCTALLDRFARYHFKRVSLGLFLLLQIPLVFCSGVQHLIKFPTFYSMPIMCALALSVWGLYLWLRGRASERPCGWYLAGSVCMALVLGCRPQLMVFSLVAFPLFWRKYITDKRICTRRGALEFACLIAPYFVAAAGVCFYNYVRFGSPLNFGANYNLTVNDMTKRGMNLGRLAPALFAYFLQMPNVTGVFPFVQPTVFDTTYLGQTIKEVTFGGIFACLPMLWLLPFGPRILKLRVEQRSTRTVAGVVIVLLISGFVVALLDAEMAGILQRYYADFSFMFLSAVVLLVFIANENLKPGALSTNLLTKVLGALVLFSVLYSGLVCFAPETGWYSDVYSWAYQDIIETVQFWT